MQVNGSDDCDDRDDDDVNDVNVNVYAAAAVAAVVVDQRHRVHFQTVTVNNQYFVHDSHAMNDDDDGDSLAVTMDDHLNMILVLTR